MGEEQAIVGVIGATDPAPLDRSDTVASGAGHAIAAAMLSAVRGVLPAAVAFLAAVAADAPPGVQSASCALDAVEWADPRRTALPAGLREVSGLAVLDDGRLLAHDDERGVITLIDPRTGLRVGQFELGPNLPRDDFEGIAGLGDRLYLSTSAGRLYEASVGRDGQVVPYRVLDTGLGSDCELEGLAADPATRTLLLPCKEPRQPRRRGQVTVLLWSLDRGEPAGERFRADVSAFGKGSPKSFRPSAIETLSGGGLLLLSGADRSIIAVTPAGGIQCVRRLPSRHRQAEGLALLPDGSLAIADEGRPGRLTVYRARRP